MGTRQRLVVPPWTGFLLIVMGFLSFLASYFLLPLYVTTLNCFDTCSPPQYPTIWELSLNMLSHLTVTPVTNALILLLCYLPLLAALMVLGSSVGFVIHPHPAWAQWSYRAELTGTIALVIFLLLLLFFILVFKDRLQLGWPGMLFGYGLFWAGSHFFLSAHPKVYDAP